MTATEFRQKLYAVLSDAARTGQEAVVTHKGRTFRIVPESGQSFLDRLVRHDTFLIPPGESSETTTEQFWQWTEERNLDGLP